MLKHRDLHECNELFELMSHPSVFPYVRHKAKSPEEFLFMTKQLIEDEKNSLAVSRTILDDWGQIIGTISIYDVQDNAGFLGTWIGKEFQGKGYNEQAKLAFLNELFFELNFNTVFLRIRVENARSIRAAQKLPYVMSAEESHKALLNEINAGETQFRLFKIPKDLFYLVTAYQQGDGEEQAM